MNKIESITNKMTEKPYLLGMGSGKLASLFNCTREDIIEAKSLSRLSLKNKDVDATVSPLQLHSRWQGADGRWLESYKLKAEQPEIIEPQDIQNIITDALKNVRSVRIYPDPVHVKQALNLWIADEHIGADTKDGLYDNKYDKDEIIKRFDKILSKIATLTINMVGKFDRINIGVLGDTFDGWNGETTRGGHKLPQSLDNRQAFKVFLDAYLYFIDALVQLNAANSIHFYFVANSNHGGDFDYIGYKTLELYMNRKYPDIHIEIFEKFVNHFHYGSHTFIISHGKDQENRKFGFPLVVDEKTKNFISDYMKLNVMQPHVHFVKGDLHRSNLDLDRMCSSKSSFTYQNVASFFGASTWIMDNFGATMPMCEYDIVSQDSYDIIRGHIYFK